MIVQGDALTVLRTLDAESVQCVVTSPPYWGLRDYKIEGQLGLEHTPGEYVEKLVQVFREVRRVLRNNGTCWLNVGDSYAGSGKGIGSDYGKAAYSEEDNGKQVPIPNGLKSKDLVGIPWRVAFALQQPYERRIITDRAWTGWLAGLVDGEGCYSCVAIPPTTGVNESHSMRLQVRMADVEAVEKIVSLTGLNSVTYDQHPPSYELAWQRPAQQWKISGDKMADLTAEIYPFLTVKRKQALVAWNIQRLKDGVITKRGQPIPEENMEKRRLLYSIIRKLNQREQADIPSWLRDPIIYSEPGWYLRSDCIWAKPNPMPESVTDRPTRAHEHLFLFSKEAHYFYDAQAIQEPAVSFPTKRPDGWATHEGNHGSFHRNGREKGKRVFGGMNKHGGRGTRLSSGNEWWPDETPYRNKRSVWTIATQPYPEAHFATFPEALVEPCLLAGSHPGDTVLDPFCGSGTTLAVAKRFGRRYLGIDLNPDYCRLAEQRLSEISEPLPYAQEASS